MQNYSSDFINQIQKYGFKAQVISFKHIKEIQLELETTKQIHKDVNTYIGKYINKFNYNVPINSLEAKSIIIIAVPQPIARINFTLDSKNHTVIMPPMYLLNSSSEFEEKHKKISEITTIVKKILSTENFKVVKANIPCKLIAVKSGLGTYGRNNICYINSESSFYWLGSYISDMPCENDFWQKCTIMDACKNCDLCLKNCPTSAISDDRFLLHTNKCITLQNESKETFPKSLNLKWHNCLIGCIRCQIICPVNKKHIKNVKDITEFSELETKKILSKTPLKELPGETYKKLELISFIEDYNLLARNLSILINNK
ncbi:4Fe-4S double cluster binding domain-containing protein [Clostridium drakei]|uniref:4Fe-4S ferredoxin n=1 Tax=Clostridium drakei TaxID=332101 RepID=A0A2U8DRQ5_9CLOT|nr:4Fe-4S double cluster binding domain-containing protein [Clostridium drakei]AWI04914.1 4Fe-4S ferredoxin [Clostridium drakei]